MKHFIFSGQEPSGFVVERRYIIPVSSSPIRYIRSAVSNGTSLIAGLTELPSFLAFDGKSITLWYGSQLFMQYHCVFEYVSEKISCCTLPPDDSLLGVATGKYASVFATVSEDLKVVYLMFYNEITIQIQNKGRS